MAASSADFKCSPVEMAPVASAPSSRNKAERQWTILAGSRRHLRARSRRPRRCPLALPLPCLRRLRDGLRLLINFPMSEERPHQHAVRGLPMAAGSDPSACQRGRVCQVVVVFVLAVARVGSPSVLRFHVLRSERISVKFKK